MTLNIVATTTDKKIAENYVSSRSDDGKWCIDKDPENHHVVQVDIEFPHNGAQLSGIVYKAETMDVKWDIYVYGEWFYFVRSWTSQLVYKVRYLNVGTQLQFKDALVLGSVVGDDEIPQNIFSIMMTHPLKRVWPFHIPTDVVGKDDRDIALRLFSEFGCKATLATTESVIQIKLINKAT